MNNQNLLTQELRTEQQMPAFASIEDAADCLGVRIRGMSSLQHESLVSSISDEDRIRYNYGDLPTALVRAVEVETTYILPDYMSSLLPLRVMGTALQAIRAAGGDISQSELFDEVREAGLMREEASPAEIATYCGVISLSYYFGRDYFCKL